MAAVKAARRRFTVDEYYRMGKAGILTSLAYDRRVKLPLYARNGVPEVSLLELRPEVISVHTEPTPTGYRVKQTRRRGDRIAPAAFPDVEFAVDDILG